ncbi:MAG TPA: hypothetical protein VD929_08750 [Caulobacteraceae bacterium]|nr:hypothetical protein [Caulobacteraceae bacterium]
MGRNGFRRTLRRFAALLGAAIVLTPAVAHAKWLKAESPHFIVYSDGAEDDLREQMLELEEFHAVLRQYHMLKSDNVPLRKFEIYLVGRTTTLQRIAPHLGQSVQGFYAAGTEDTFAVAVRTKNDNTGRQFLFHEYTHHFMMQYFPYPYPSWLVEGWAEYFMTVEPGVKEITVGEPSDLRAMSFQWIPMEDLVGKHHGQLKNDDSVHFYGQAWLLTHYMLSDDTRQKQLIRYMNMIGQGAGSLKAFEEATGMTMTAAARALRDYASKPLPYRKWTRRPRTDMSITVTALGPSADDLLLEGQRMKRGVAEDDRPGFLQTIRARAAKHPGDRLAELTLAHTEISIGDRARGEAILSRMLAANPDDVDALLLMAESRLGAVEDDTAPAVKLELYREARRYAAKAAKLDQNRYQAFYTYALTRSLEANYPTNNDLEAVRTAYVLAPQVTAVRMAAAQALMRRGEYEEVVAVVAPFANSPHGGEAAKAARAMLEEARAKLSQAPAAPAAAPAG